MSEELKGYVDNYIAIHIVDLASSAMELFPEADESEIYQYVEDKYGINLRDIERRPEYQPGTSTGGVSTTGDTED